MTRSLSLKHYGFNEPYSNLDTKKNNNMKPITYFLYNIKYKIIIDLNINIYRNICICKGGFVQKENDRNLYEMIDLNVCKI